MKTKVFYTSNLARGIIVYGEIDGLLSRQTGEFISVNGQLIHRGFVMLDTAKNRKRLADYRSEYAAWESMKPSIHVLTNGFER